MASARYASVQHHPAATRPAADSELSQQAQWKIVPQYILPSKIRAQTRDTPYAPQKPGDQSSDYIEGDAHRPNEYAAASKASTAGDYRAQKQPPNQNYESRSMIIDRSSSLTSSGRFHPEPLLKLQRVADGEPPLPVI